LKMEVKEKNVEEQFDRTLRFQISFGREILKGANFGNASPITLIDHSI